MIYLLSLFDVDLSMEFRIWTFERLVSLAELEWVVMSSVMGISSCSE